MHGTSYEEEGPPQWRALSIQVVSDQNPTPIPPLTMGPWLK